MIQSMRDFTLKSYEKLCRSIKDLGRQSMTVHEYISRPRSCKNIVIFRHDVDRNPSRALHLAKLEYRCGIQSTFYFRTKASTFKPDIIKKINNLGHEIGYHYETLAECGGDHKKAIVLFEKELVMFREICPVTTISMHGRPLSKFDNRDLWKKYDFRKYGIIGECYLSIDYNTVLYLSDTGRTWHPTRYNVRDHVSRQDLPQLDTTIDLIQFLQHKRNQPACLLTHPNRWCDSFIPWCVEWISDQCINQIKQLLVWVRR